jgi:uncharacterized protein with GYD domain
MSALPPKGDVGRRALNVRFVPKAEVAKSANWLTLCPHQLLTDAPAAESHSKPRENYMLFIMSLNFTERGIREIKDDLKRAQAAQDLAKKCGCEIKQIFLTSGESDVVQIIETANGDNIAKYALANGSLGFVRSRTALAWPLEEATKIISELP